MLQNLIKYYNSRELSQLQKDWDNMESMNFSGGVSIEELFNAWDFVEYNSKYFPEPKNVRIQFEEAPISSELFLYI